MNDDGPSPVGNDVVVGPLEPQEKRTGENFQLPEVNDATEIGVAGFNGGDGDSFEHGELFGADVHALGSWAAKVPTAAPRSSTLAVSLEPAPMGFKPGFCGISKGLLRVTMAAVAGSSGIKIAVKY